MTYGAGNIAIGVASRTLSFVLAAKDAKGAKKGARSCLFLSLGVLGVLGG